MTKTINMPPVRSDLDVGGLVPVSAFVVEGAGVTVDSEYQEIALSGQSVWPITTSLPEYSLHFPANPGQKRIV
jgi:hypothetical protein